MIEWSTWMRRWEHLREQPLLLGCSGGVDSMVLLHLLHQGGFHVTVAHVNYHLRGDASNLDEALVRSQAAALGFPCRVKSVFLKEHLEEGGNLQAKAREVRFAFFRECCEEKPMTVVLGHHGDDQLETFWLMLSRGAGMHGLSGMREESESVIRPLLPFSKADIYAFARNAGIVWREDASNQSTDYQRNRWRNVYFPLLDSQLPSWRGSVAVLQRYFQRELSTREQRLLPWLEVWKAETFLTDDDLLAFDEEDLRMLFRWLDLPLRWVAVWSSFLAGEKGKQLVAEAGILTRERSGVSFWDRTLQPIPEWVVEDVDFLPTVFSHDEVYLDADKLRGNLRLERWKTGDRIFPIGMQGSKLISAVLKERHVHFPTKQNTWVLRDDYYIHWIVGRQIGRMARPDSRSKNVWKIALVEK